jgi:large subunit ribosomal protein L33
MKEGGYQRARTTIALACSVCHSRNYKTTKARTDGSATLKLKKFCKICDKHTVHEETK